MIDQSPPMHPVGEVLKRARQAAIHYHRLTGKPLSIIGPARFPNICQGFGTKLDIDRQPHPPQVPVLKKSAFGLMTYPELWLPRIRIKEFFFNDSR